LSATNLTGTPWQNPQHYVEYWTRLHPDGKCALCATKIKCMNLSSKSEVM
jgi:hypothetical protein